MAVVWWACYGLMGIWQDLWGLFWVMEDVVVGVSGSKVDLSLQMGRCVVFFSFFFFWDCFLS